MKYFSPLKFAISIVSIIICGFVSYAQEPTDLIKYSTPVNWTKYSVPAQKLTVMFPKLPVMQTRNDLCSEKEGASYYAYAGGAVYGFEWHAKSRSGAPSMCPTKSKFSRASLTRHIDGLKAQRWAYAESETTVAGLPATMLRSTADINAIVVTRWLIWQKDRWFELSIARRNDTAVDEGNFLDGLQLSKSTGIDIKNGATAILGDPDIESPINPLGQNAAGMVLIEKPRAGFTDAARNANVQGTVVLKVVFLRNGGVGSVSVVKSLPLGLTEQAIAAAKKIAFLPATDDGKTMSVIKQVEYSFSIY